MRNRFDIALGRKEPEIHGMYDDKIDVLQRYLNQPAMIALNEIAHLDYRGFEVQEFTPAETCVFNKVSQEDLFWDPTTGPTTFRDGFRRTLYIPELVLRPVIENFLDGAFRGLDQFSAKKYCDLTVIYATHCETFLIGFVIQNLLARAYDMSGITGLPGGASEVTGFYGIPASYSGFTGLQGTGATRTFGNGPFITGF